MKKKILIGVGVVLSIALLAIVVVISNVGGAEIAEGTYNIVDFEAYPDANIIVTENKLQFNNIDLNAIYGKALMDEYNKTIESGFSFNIPDDQLSQVSDLNKLFVENAYEIDYSLETAGSKYGTFSYIYYCFNTGTPFGLVLEYNSLEKTLQINNPVQKIVFKK